MTFLALWAEREAAIEKSQERVVNIAKHLTHQQTAMISETEQLTQFLANTIADDTNLPSTCPEYFHQTHTLYNNVANIGVVDVKGNLMCVTNGIVKNVSISDRQYFKNAIANKSFSIGYFQYDRSIQAPSVNFASPIISERGQLKGVVVTVIALNWWNTALNKAEFPNGSKAVIADSNGLVLASYPNSLLPLGEKINNKHFLHGDNSLAMFKDANNVNQIFHRATIYNDINNNNLEIYITSPTDKYIARANTHFLETIILFFSAILTIAFIGHRIIRKSIFYPIEELAQATDLLAQGNMPTKKIKPNSPELSALYSRFEVMAETRLQTEADLKNKHDELTGLLNALPDMYLRLNNLGKVLNISGTIIPLFSANNKSPKKLLDILPTDIAKQILNEASTRKDVITFDFKISTGITTHYFEAHINHLEKNDELILVLRDISQRKVNEDSLHLASLVYGNSSESMAITDANGIIFDVNPAFCETTQYSKDEVIGHSTRILSSGEHSKEFYEKIWASINATGRWQGEIINRKKDGVLFTEWLNIDTVYDENNNPARRIAIFTDLTEKIQANKTIWRQAHFDHLTDLPNRLELKKRLNKQFSNSKNENENETFVVMLLDIDHFKDINDTLGHHYGDNLLKLVSQRIVNSAKNAEFVARIGGDEFVIVFNQVKSTRHINQIASNILQSLSSALHIDNEEVFISASMGIACAPDDGENTEQLLKAADQAMYKAKSNGRNGFEFFSRDMREHAQARMHLLKDLRCAIEYNQFELFYQPIVSLNDLHIHKAEGLIRWQHPQKGLISPVAFIPLAEETRQINAIGQFVFSQAIETLAEIKKITDNDFQISINVSPIQLSTANSGIDDWYAMLDAAKIPPSSIVAEITEGLMVNPEELTQKRLKQIVKSGMQLALDDFGTGYSSLAYLQEMDTDYLKIDKRFVDNIKANSQELSLCEAIIVMAHQLGLKVIAEGIETPLQYQLLTEAGCDYGQGYLFSKPLNKNDFMTLITNKRVMLSKLTDC